MPSTAGARTRGVREEPTRGARGRVVIAAALVAVLALAGCSSSGSGRTADTVPSNATAAGPPAGSNSTTGTDATTGSTSTTTPGTIGTLPADTVIINPGSSPYGDILVDPNNHTFYIFTGDTSTVATCVGTCADTWAPVLGTQIGVAQSLSYSPGEFKLVRQPNGTSQLTVNGRPVYTYKSDSRGGETAGQGSGGQWYVIGTDGQPITKKT